MKVVDIYTNGELNPESVESTIFHIAVLCNKAGYGRDADGVERVFGDPTEIGLIESAQDHGYTKAALEKTYPTITEFPFDSERKRMSIMRTY